MADIDFTKVKDFDDLLIQSQKEFGKEIIRIGSDNAIAGVQWWDLDSLKIKDLLGKGTPKGRIIEIFGDESSGKTCLCNYITGQIQKQGGKAVYIDTENAIDPSYAKQMGLDLDNCIIVNPDFGEQALDIIEKMAQSNLISVIVLDSLAALSPKAEIEGEMTDQTMGLMARNNSKFFRKVVGLLNKTKTTLLITNQQREKIGVVYGSPLTTTGGKALKFYASIRLKVSKIEELTDTKLKIPKGIKCKIKAVKNKIAIPFREIEIDLLFGKGYDTFSECIDYAIEYDIIKKTGGWFLVPNKTDKIQGKESVVNYYKENEQEYVLLKEKVSEIFNNRYADVDEKKERIIEEDIENESEESDDN